MIGMSGEDGDCAIDLLGGHDPHKLVRPRHGAKGQHQRGPCAQRGIDAIGAADHEDITAGPGITRSANVAALTDPRSAWQPEGVFGPSAVIDHNAFAWHDAHWQSPPLDKAIIYELHIGTFSPAGTFDGAIPCLDHLVHLGVTHVEIMPVNEFAGAASRSRAKRFMLDTVMLR